MNVLLHVFDLNAVFLAITNSIGNEKPDYF